VILGTHPLSPEDENWLVEEMAKEDYFKIFGHKPLVYYGNWDGIPASEVLGSLTAKCRAMGFDPFIVGLNAQNQHLANMHVDNGASALSFYTGYTLGLYETAYWESNFEYAMEINRNYDLNISVVPQITTGWDTTPRNRGDINRPYKFYAGGFQRGISVSHTSEKITAHLLNAMNWNYEKSKENEEWPNTILIYSWNEFSEGRDVICPRFDPDNPGVLNTSVIDAIKEAIINGPEGYNPSKELSTIEIIGRNDIQYPVVFDTNGGKFPTFRFNILTGEAENNWIEPLSEISLETIPANARPQTLLKGDKIIPPQEMIPKDGHVFAGWYKNEDLTIPWDFENDLVQGNTVLYAKWESLD
jgi:uncharacterized repeat protein (TIGR02543 family)